jgi:hypothetical protein
MNIPGGVTFRGAMTYSSNRNNAVLVVKVGRIVFVVGEEGTTGE